MCPVCQGKVPDSATRALWHERGEESLREGNVCSRQLEKPCWSLSDAAQMRSSQHAEAWKIFHYL